MNQENFSLLSTGTQNLIALFCKIKPQESVKMKYAICNETYENWPLENIVADAADAGYEGLEVAPFTLSPDPREITYKQAEDYGKIVQKGGLEMVGFHWLLLAPKGLHLTTCVDPVRQSTVLFLQHLVRLCAAMGGKVMVLGSPFHRDFLVNENREDVFNRAIDSCSLVADVAQANGVQIALEPLPEANFIQNAKEGMELIKAVNNPAFQLHLDVKAMSYEEISIPEIIHQSREALIHFHANDPNLRGPGMGEVDFLPIYQALNEIRYEGYMSVEVFDYKPNAPTIARESLRYMKECEQQSLASPVEVI